MLRDILRTGKSCANIANMIFDCSCSTSLSNIFGSSPRHNKANENESLKYTPPKPVDNTTSKPVDAKTTECVFACALTAYVWYVNFNRFSISN